MMRRYVRCEDSSDLEEEEMVAQLEERPIEKRLITVTPT